MNTDIQTQKGLVSIGLPTYNRPDSLKRMLTIISAQTYPNLEIIVSDNASSDERVGEVIEDFARLDPRLKHYRQEHNKGVLANAAFVLSKATGEYFTWFSDDDWRAPEFIDILVAELEKNQNVDMAFCDYHEVYEDGSRARGYPKTHRGVFKPFASPHRLVRTLSYYWQDPVRGKCNIFYSVFRRAALSALDLRKISGEYKHLSTDSLIVFALLQAGPVAVTAEAMCALTCGNKKLYAEHIAGGKKRAGALQKLLAFYNNDRRDTDLYIQNTDLAIERLLINLSFFPRLTFMLVVLLLKRSLPRLLGNLTNMVDSWGERRRPHTRASRPDAHFNVHSVRLPNVTLVAVATRNVEETLQALLYSCRAVKFGSVKLLSHYTPHELQYHPEVVFHRIKKMEDIDEWSHEITYHLHEYIETDFALLIHADGFVVNPSSWKDEFLDYDYVGAPWPLPSDDFSYRDVNGNIVRVGNSVSLRSRRLLCLASTLNLPWEPYHGFFNEDGFVCAKNRHIYESHGIKFAPLGVARHFSHEAMIPEVRGLKPFAFHKWAGANRRYPRF